MSYNIRFVHPRLLGLICSVFLISEPASADLLTLSFDGDASPGSIYQKDSCKAVEGGLADYPCVKYVPGKHGQAIQLNQYSVVAAPVQLDPQLTPQITFTAWIKRPLRGGNGGFILSSGGAGGLPHLSLYGGALSIKGGRSSIRYPDGFQDPPRDEWVFVAGVWDYEAHTMRLHQDDLHQSYSGQKMNLDQYVLAESPTWIAPDGSQGTERNYVFIGAENFVSYGTTATKVAIDDVRLFSRALSVAEIESIRQGIDGTPSAVGTATSSDPNQATQTGSTGIPAGADSSGEATGSEPGGGLLSGQQAPVSGTDDLADKAPIDLEYESDEAALAAQREREAAQAEGEQQGSTENPASSNETQTRQEPLEEEQAGSGYHMSSEFKPTGISGIQGENIYPLDFKDIGIRRIGVYRPRYINGIPYRIEVQNGPSTRTLHAGTGRYSGDSPMFYAGFIDRTRITALATCDNNKASHRLKGVEIRGHEIGKNGDFGAYGKETSYTANCRHWNQLVACNSDSLATGVVAHFNKNSNSLGNKHFEELVGIQLICRKVIPNE